jgi:hypothetical protein
MFSDPDRVDHSDDSMDYPSSDEDEDADTDADDNESTYSDDEFEEAHPWTTLTHSVKYDLEHPPEEDEFYDTIEVEEVPATHKGIEYFDAIAPPTHLYVWLCPRPSPWWHAWMQHHKVVFGDLKKLCSKYIVSERGIIDNINSYITFLFICHSLNCCHILNSLLNKHHIKKPMHKLFVDTIKGITCCINI